MTFSVAEQSTVALLLAALRTTAWLFIAPPFSTSGLPRTVKVMFGVTLAAVVAPTLAGHTPPTSDTAAFLGSGVMQVFTGFALGFSTRLIFAAVESAGSLLDVVGGFSLSFAFDPLGRTNTSILGRFYGMFATVLLLVTPAHEYVLLGFLRSFDAVPLDATVHLGALGSTLTHGLTQMFVATLQIAGPLILVLLLADVALGLLNRIAPQLNAFSLSFPLKIVLTLALVGMTFGLFPDIVRSLGEQAGRVVSTLVG